DLLDGAGALAKMISEDIHEDRLQPASAGFLLLQAPERPIGLQQRLLHEILRAVPHEPAGQRIQPRELLPHELLEGFLGSIRGADPTHFSLDATSTMKERTSPEGISLHHGQGQCASSVWRPYLNEGGARTM